MAKLLENTYRHVNIALVNEMARFCHELDIDLWNVIELAKTKPFGFQAFYPGPGVGGHCIPIDPNYLSHRVEHSWAIHSASWSSPRRSTRRMPSYVAQRAQNLLNDNRQRSTARPCCCSASRTKPTSPTVESLRPSRWPSGCSG